MATLDPKLDVVFKLLFAAERNRDLLIALLTAVLRPAREIVEVEVINPEIEKNVPDDRGLILDILAVHADGTRTNIEMQAQDRGETQKRALYHWARVYRDGISRGEAFSDLPICRVVFFLSYRLLPGRRLHSTFQVREIHDGTTLSEELEIHMVELPKLAGGESEPDEAALRDWVAFLAAETDEERRRIAMGNPQMEKANTALEELSQDPKAQMLARWREDELRFQRMELASAEQRGREEGREETLRDAIRGLCGVLGVELSSPREERLASATADELQALHQDLLRLRRWPD